MPDDKRLEEIRLTLRRIGLIRGKEFDTKAQKIWDLAQDLLDVSDALRAELKALTAVVEKAVMRQDCTGEVLYGEYVEGEYQPPQALPNIPALEARLKAAREKALEEAAELADEIGATGSGSYAAMRIRSQIIGRIGAE